MLSALFLHRLWKTWIEGVSSGHDFRKPMIISFVLSALSTRLLSLHQPSRCLTLLPVHWFCVSTDESHHRGIIRELYDQVPFMSGCTVMCKQSKQQRTELSVMCWRCCFCGPSVRKSRAQRHEVVFRPRSRSFSSRLHNNIMQKVASIFNFLKWD